MDRFAVLNDIDALLADQDAIQADLDARAQDYFDDAMISVRDLIDHSPATGLTFAVTRFDQLAAVDEVGRESYTRSYAQLVALYNQIVVPIRSSFELPNGQILHNVHAPGTCGGEHCVIHHPSQHPLSNAVLEWDDIDGYFYRRCEHGIRHPDLDQFDFWMRTGQYSKMTHRCDNCCEGDELVR